MMSLEPASGVSALAISYDESNASGTTPVKAPTRRYTALTRACRRSASSWAASTMPSAIESSCISRLEGSQGRLAQADPAVVGWHGTVGPRFELLRSDQRGEVFQQKLILKDAARDHDGVEFVRAAERHGRVGQATRDASVKRPRDLADLAPAPAVPCHPVEERAKVELAVREGEWVTIGSRRSASLLLEPDRRLTLERDRADE